MRTLIDIGRLIIFILLLPIAIILIGPLLVLAVFRGQQQMGPIVLNSSRYDIVGRMGILMLGVALWLLVWSGLFWFALLATSPSIFVRIPFISPDISDPVSEPTLAMTPPTVSIVTPPSATPTAQAETLPDVSGTPDTNSLTPTPSVFNTATQVINTPSPEISPIPTSTARPTPTPTATAAPTSAGQPTITSVDEESIIATITEANLLLQDAIILPSEENLANLGALWQDRALTKVESFATDQYERYRKPFSAQFEFITSPTISEESSDQIIITSRERWSYGGASSTDQESFEFIYTLIQEDDRWIITHYSYRNLASPTPRNVLATSTITATSTIQN